MGMQIPLQFMSNIAAIGLLIVLGFRYLEYKKNLDVIKELDRLNDEGKLTSEDAEFINSNEKEYRDKLIAAESTTKFSNPVFILLVGLLLFSFPFQEALIHANVLVVAFLFMRIDKIHKKNLYSFLYELKKTIKEEK